MNKFVGGLIFIVAISGFAMAAGEVPGKAPVAAPDGTGFYMGITYSYIDYDMVKTVNVNGSRSSAERDTDHHAFMLQAGYQYNKYLAFEGRRWAATNENLTVNGLKRTKTLEAYGIYLKPMYPVKEDFTLYGLLGYSWIRTSFIAYRRNGSVNDQGLDDKDFSWGLGFSYKINGNLHCFADFVRIYDDEQSQHLAAPLVGTKEWDMTIDSYNIGFTYQF